MFQSVSIKSNRISIIIINIKIDIQYWIIFSKNKISLERRYFNIEL